MNAREYALNILYQVITDHGYASLLMRKLPDDMPKQEKAMVSELVYGTLRNRSLLEHQWEGFAGQKTNTRTAVLLDMSVYQMFLMDRIPAYAAINEAVALAGKKDGSFVNAVLHRVLDQGIKYCEDPDPLVRASVNLSHPLWVLKLWKAHYGEETALRLAEYDQTKSKVYGRLNTLKCRKEDLDPQRYHFVNDVSFLYDGVITDTDEFRSGSVLIQDRSSAMIPQWLQAEAGMDVLDVCAAPGTKTQQIAMYMENQGQITACDLYEHRLALVERLMKLTGTKIVQTAVRDGTDAGSRPALNRFDRILIDAPCSGLGDLRHKPEIRWHLKPKDIDALCGTQSALLETNYPCLKPGGKLVYSTCTLNRKENEGLIKRFLAAHPDAVLEEEHTYLPFEEDSDGFYVCRITRKGVC